MCNPGLKLGLAGLSSLNFGLLGSVVKSTNEPELASVNSQFCLFAAFSQSRKVSPQSYDILNAVASQLKFNSAFVALSVSDPL